MSQSTSTTMPPKNDLENIPSFVTAIKDLAERSWVMLALMHYEPGEG